ncbi:S8 family serine peptidase [Azohydromonas caseinilytica]|uniref:S8 family serine peptidase n=1 Tax=Azohydromonas caseinilytica TaxID=2728836 RepID=A0A848FD49_9BURK|nr:S8 family serine peptidase [Azohydromonas caseinilytica]NML16213.1 S8 family serine peptidase [Azohydromonas caseinilytica]
MATNTVEPAARYVLLPVRGLHSDDLARVGANQALFEQAASARLNVLAHGLVPPHPHMRVLHSICPTGPKLVEMGPAERAALRVSDPGVRAVPLVRYEQARRPLLEIESELYPAATVAAATTLAVRCLDARTRQPVRRATVLAFTDFARRIGAGGLSDAQGQVALRLGAAPVRLDVLVAYGPPGYWGIGRRDVVLEDGAALEMEPVDLSVPDFAAELYGQLPPDAGRGVTVGVIDSGVDFNHPDLELAGGGAFVAEEGDAGGPGPAQRQGEHGTHVAGIIASTGSLQPGRPAPGKRGVAPGVRLYGYRVFPNSGQGATNYDIVRAIDQGVADGCDLLNLSLGSAYADEAVEAALKDAFDRGTLCIAAAGNDGRGPVSYPAAWALAVAVSSAAKKGTYPPGSSEVLDEVEPFAPIDPRIYISGFSNVGPAIDLAGPGGGIVSTLPGGLYGVMSGTSMACPAVTGMAAALLSARPDLLGLPRGRERSIALLGLLTQAARPLGFDPTLEGAGLPR